MLCTFTLYDKHYPTNILVLCTFTLYNKHYPTNIPVLCTFTLYDKHYPTNILVLCTLSSSTHKIYFRILGNLKLSSLNAKQQSCEIFVEILLNSRTTGAEHRNIKSQLIKEIFLPIMVINAYL